MGILAATGVVQVIRKEWFDTVLFLSAAVFLAVDILSDRGAGPTRPRVRTGFILTGAALFAPLLWLLPLHGAAIMVTLGTIGVSAMLVAWSQKPGRWCPWSPAQQRLAWSWGTVLVVGCLWELMEFLLGRVDPQSSSFALSDLLEPIVETTAGRAVFVLAWVLLGAFLLRRVGTR